MTSPEFRPVDPEPGSATEPVPPVQPPAQPAVPAYGYPPAGPQGAPVFMPAAPEPVYAGAQHVSSGGRKSSSNLLTYALVGAALIAAVGVSFAVGRASSADSVGGSARAGVGTQNQARGQFGNGGGVFDPNGNGNGNGSGGGNGNANGQGNGNGNGPLTGRDPNATFDLNGAGDGNGGDPDGGLGFDRGFGRGFGPGGLTGTVTAVGSDSVTIKLANGQTVTFGLDGSTTYHQEAPATASDVKQGATVQVSLGDGFRPDQITRGSDGTITLGTAGNVTVVP